MDCYPVYGSIYESRATGTVCCLTPTDFRRAHGGWRTDPQCPKAEARAGLRLGSSTSGSLNSVLRMSA